MSFQVGIGSLDGTLYPSGNYDLSRATYAWDCFKENTKCDASRWFVVKSHNAFSLRGNKYRVYTIKEESFVKIFFRSLLSGRKRHIIRVRINAILFGECDMLSNTHHIIFAICFKFKTLKEHFCDVCRFSFSLLLLKMSFKCSINVNQQSKEETLIFTRWWYKAGIDKDITK